MANWKLKRFVLFIVANGGEGIKAGLPSFQFPLISLSLETLFFITPYALILAAIGLIESLMTLNLIDELTDSHGSGNRECVAQGAGNLVNGLFGGMGGSAMIGQSIINIKSGGRVVCLELQPPSLCCFLSYLVRTILNKYPFQP